MDNCHSVNHDLAKNLLPLRPDGGNKGTFGCLLSLCGSRNMPGAAWLSSAAALRCGVGLLRLASVPHVLDVVQRSLPEPIYTPMPESTAGQIGHLPHHPVFQDGKTTAVLFGCGIGQSLDGGHILRHLLEENRQPLVIDADGLNLLAANADLLVRLSRLQAPVILTPHMGEMARLWGRSVTDIQADRQRIALDFAMKYKVSLVLKDHITLITAPDGHQWLLDAPNPGLAKGGSGDVLAGCIASFLAQRMDPTKAALLGVWTHSRAGALAREVLGTYGMLPRDVIDFIPKALMELE